MNTEPLIDASRHELDLVLGFFSRLESKSSVVLAIATAMIGFLAANAPALSAFSKWMYLSSGLTIFLLSVSFGFLYRGGFPNLSGGESSLVYFREIAKRREQKFIEEFTAQTEKEYATDLLAQVWRNSQILTIKFDSLKWAFVTMALAIVPWVVSLVLFATYNSTSPHPSLFKP
jgi:hypothetical protein